MITTPHPYYITPSRIQINSFFRGMGFKGAYSPTMAQEICNAYSHIMYGGNVAEAFDGPGYGKPGYEKNLKDFLSKLDYSYEGRTPMAKALSIIATIYNQKSTSTQNTESGGEDDNEALDLFSESDSSCGSKLAQNINDDLDRYEKLMPTGSYTAKTFGADGKDTLKSVAAAKLDIRQLNVLNKLARLKIYENEIAAHKEITWKVNPLSTDVKTVPLTEFSQSLKVSHVERAMPHYQYKLATKQLMIKEHIKYTIKKQCLAFLIDDSGSMCDNFKMEWVKALLLNRIDQVIRGEAELFICTFEDQLDENAWIPVRNKEEADEVLENFHELFKFDRGATDIEKAVTQAITDIKSGTLNGNITIDSIKPQICVINDGDDYISPHYTPDFVVHGFILGSTNHNMKKMCEKSGGIYEQFNR